MSEIEITQADKDRAARFYAAQAFGKSKAEILSDWEALEASEEGYCNPLALLFSQCRHEARAEALEDGKNNWDGLARSIMMAFDCDAKTPRAIFKHLSMVGQPVPKWMRDEAEMQNLDHVISKGTRCVLIYRAMAEPALRSGEREG